MERKGFIGGSDVVKIQDPSNWFELWEIKTGRRESEDLSDVLAVQMGVNTEDFNINWFFFSSSIYRSCGWVCWV